MPSFRETAIAALSVCFLAFFFVPRGAEGQEPPAAAQDAAPAPAQASGDPYYVEDVAVSKTAASGEAARDAAVAEAERSAFIAVLKRFLPEAGEKVAEEYGAGAVSAMITEMDIRGEHVGERYYEAKFSLRFRPASIKNIVGASAVPQTAAAPATEVPEEDAAPPPAVTAEAMALPVFEDGDDLVQWDKDHAWGQAWKSVALATGAFVVPSAAAPVLHPLFLGDIRGGTLTAEDQTRIRRFLEAYGPAQHIVAALASYAPPSGSAPAALRMYAAEITPAFRKLTAKEIYLRPDESFEAFVTRGARSLYDDVRKEAGLAELDESKLQGAAPSAFGTDGAPSLSFCTEAQETSVTVMIPAYNLQEWVKTEERMKAAQGVKSVTPRSLAPGRMVVDVIHVCGSGLGESLRRSGLQYDELEHPVAPASGGEEGGAEG
jgi:hypothetical protein